MSFPNNKDIDRVLDNFQHSYRLKDFTFGLVLIFFQFIVIFLQLSLIDTSKNLENIEFLIFSHFFIGILIICLQILFLRYKKIGVALINTNKIKSEFLANISHELRTPLNAIIGFSEILIDSPNPALNGEFKDMIRIINDSSCHLLDLVNDLIQISKENATELSLNKTESNIHELINRCTRFFQYKLQKYDFSVKFLLSKEDEMIWIDKRLILQVLINLLGNAIKFTPEGKSVGIEIKRNLDLLYITIWDQGIGIESKDIKKLFHPFSQLNANTYSKNIQGSGLGLYISKKIIELHEGQIVCESQIGVGSKFIITISYKNTQLYLEKKAENLMDILWDF